WGPVALTTCGPGHAITGASTSFTVTWNEHEFVPVVGLLAVAVTFVKPTSNAEPDLGVELVVTSLHMPAAGVEKFTTALHLPGSLFTVIGPGQSIDGGGSGKFGARSTVAVVSWMTKSLKVPRYSVECPTSEPRYFILPMATVPKAQSGALAAPPWFC